MFCELDGVAVEVPPLVVFSQYIVPPEPPLAVKTVLPQTVPPPLMVIAVGVGKPVTTTGVREVDTQVLAPEYVTVIEPLPKAERTEALVLVAEGLI